MISKTILKMIFLMMRTKQKNKNQASGLPHRIVWESFSAIEKFFDTFMGNDLFLVFYRRNEKKNEKGTGICWYR